MRRSDEHSCDRLAGAPLLGAVQERRWRLAFLARLSLGRLPLRAARADCAEFDLSESREYCGGAEAPVAGAELAGVAALVVRWSRSKAGLLRVLEDVSAAMIEPLKVYLRVKLAMGRLRAELGQTEAGRAEMARGPAPFKTSETADEAAPPSPAPDASSPAIDTPPKRRRAQKTKCREARPAAFHWDISPAKAYGFAKMTADYGYDPRETSAYWIEARAARLRGKWARYSRAARGLPEPPKPLRAPTPVAAPENEDSPPEVPVRHFTPVDAGFNEVWPPLELPSAPPPIDAAFVERIDAENPRVEDSGCEDLAVDISVAQNAPAEIARVDAPVFDSRANESRAAREGFAGGVDADDSDEVEGGPHEALWQEICADYHGQDDAAGFGFDAEDEVKAPGGVATTKHNE